MSKRFQVLSVDEAKELYPNWSYADYGWVLVEWNPCLDKIIRIVGEDGGEPEDQSLVRDWYWVVDELNALVDEYRKYINEAIIKLESAP